MLARAVNVPFRPDRVDEANRIVQDEIVPVLEERAGFEDQLLLVQRDTAKPSPSTYGRPKRT